MITILSNAVAGGGIGAAIAAINYLQGPAVALYFLGAQVYAIAQIHRPSKAWISIAKRRTAIGLLFFICITYVVQAAFYISRVFNTPPQEEPEHSIIHVLGGSMVFLCLPLAILSDENPLWHPHVGSWAIGFVLEAILCGLHATSVVSDMRDNEIVIILTVLRIVVFGSLLVDGSLVIWEQRSARGIDEERQPLLGTNGSPTENGHANDGAYGTIQMPESSDSTSKPAPSDGVEPDDGDDDQVKKQQQERLENEGGWLGYLKGFSIFLPYIWPRDDWKGKLCIAVLVYDMLQDRVVNVLIPRQIGIITNQLTAGGSMPWKETLIWFLLRWLPSKSGTGALQWFASTHMENYSYQKICDISFHHVMTLSMDFHTNKDSGEVLKSVEQANALNSLLETVLDLVPVLADFTIALFYVTYLFDIYVAFIILVLCVFYIWLSIKTTTWAQVPRRTYIKNNRNETKTVLESISNWQTVSYFNRSTYERERYKDAVQLSISSYWTLLLRYFVQAGSQSLLMTLGFSSCALIAVWEVNAGRRPVGNFITFIMYWSTIVSPLSIISYQYKAIASSLVDAERVLQLLLTKSTVVELADAKDIIITDARIELANVDFAYDPRKPVLKRVNFVAEPGQTVALVGETGGGKSTILKLLFRFYDVTGGAVRIDGQDIRTVRLSSLRETLGVVPQDPSMFNQTIIENIRYARLDATDEEIMEACKAAAVHDKIMSFPDGYKSKVGERGVKLSGGELQRVAIARVLVKNPKIVMLDEATSAVDSSTEQQIQEAFKKLSAGRTTFVVAHRLSTIMEADLIIVIDQGEIVERGTHEELLLRGGKYLELWTKQTQRPFKAPSGAPSSPSSQQAENPLINDIPKETWSRELAKGLGVDLLDQEGETADQARSSAIEAYTDEQPSIRITRAYSDADEPTKD